MYFYQTAPYVTLLQSDCQRGIFFSHFNNTHLTYSSSIDNQEAASTAKLSNIFLLNYSLCDFITERLSVETDILL